MILIFKQKFFIIFKIIINFLIPRFKNFKEAKNFSKKELKSDYNNSYLNSYRREKLEIFKHLIAKKSKNKFKNLDLAIKIFIKRYKRFPKVLDFGGGYGEIYYYLNKKYKNKIKISICETKYVKKDKLKNKSIIFFDNLNLAINSFKPDIVYSNAAFNFLENPLFYLRILIKKKIKIISFSRIMVGEEYFSIQASLLSENGFPKTLFGKYREKIIFYPFQNINKKKFINCLNKNYNLIKNYTNKNKLEIIGIIH